MNKVKMIIESMKEIHSRYSYDNRCADMSMSNCITQLEAELNKDLKLKEIFKNNEPNLVEELDKVLVEL